MDFTIDQKVLDAALATVRPAVAARAGTTLRIRCSTSIHRMCSTRAPRLAGTEGSGAVIATT